jgi:hypothetical protein
MKLTYRFEILAYSFHNETKEKRQFNFYVFAPNHLEATMQAISQIEQQLNSLAEGHYIKALHVNRYKNPIN